MKITEIVLCLGFTTPPFFSYFLNSWKQLKLIVLVVKKLLFYLGCRNPFFGSTQFNWLSTGRDLCLSKVSVAADYSDSVPDSSNYVNNRGYHPLEELKFHKRVRDTKLTSAEIARTTAEVSALSYFEIIKLKEWLCQWSKCSDLLPLFESTSLSKIAQS